MSAERDTSVLDPAGFSYRRWIAAPAIVVIGLVLAALLGRSWILTEVLKYKLAALGVTDASFTVSRLDAHGAELEDVAGTNEAMSARRITHFPAQK